MFYSHEILTSRQHGVATVWLVATLGSKSTLRKVTRKAILDVDVPKACGTIQDPSAPMALRLQGNLLYGVSRVYSQQCGYVLADTQSFRDKVKGVVVVLKELELDLDAGKARPDQLNLPDDPAFLPDFDMFLDISMFDTRTDTSGFSSSMTPPSFLSSRSSMAREPVEHPALVLPSAVTPLGRDLGGFGFGGDTSSPFKAASRAGRVSAFEDTGVIEDPGFEFDAEGNLVIEPAAAEERESPAHSATGPASKLGSDSAISAQVRKEHEAGLQGAQSDHDFDFDDAPQFLADDELPLPEAPPFSPAPRLSAAPAERAPHTSSARPEEEPSSSAEAPQHKVRAPKTLQPDYPQEVANSDLAHWNTNYLVNMAAAIKIKEQHKAVAMAKKNAAFWVLGQGIAGVGVSLEDGRVPNPLAIFSGQALLAALAGIEMLAAGTKRTRSLSDGLDGEGGRRRVKARAEEEEHVGRGDAGGNDTEGVLAGDDDGMDLFPGEDMDVEVGRQAPESLHGDHSSQMPWNVSGSRHGSSRPFGSGFLGGISSSVGGQGAGVDFGPPSAHIGRRGSRLMSASPLLSRGGTLPRYSSLELPERATVTAGEVGGEMFDDNGGMPLGDDDVIDDPEFQLYGPAAAVDTQTAAQSQWVAAALDVEAQNFLVFLRAEIDAKTLAADAADQVGGQLEDEDSASVTFEALLPPIQHSKVVAAQGLLHVLSLATKGLIQVKQEEAFEKIEIGIVRAEEEDEAGLPNSDV